MRSPWACALVAALAGTLLQAPVASADTRGCVTSSEYYGISRGWTPKRVAALVDTSGTAVFDRTYPEQIPQAGGSTLVTWHQVVVRSYKKCSTFDGGRGR